MFKIVVLTLGLLVPISAQAYDFHNLFGYDLSSTLISEPLSMNEALFVRTVALHFSQAQVCWHQKQIPRVKTITRIIDGSIMMCRRHWPKDTDKLYQFFAVIISESGGNNVGNPSDPSFGVCHSFFESAHHACRIFGYPHPRCRLCDEGCRGLTYRANITFKDLLAEDIIFNIMCGSGELRLAEDECGGDWVRAILIYKHGLKGFSRAFNGLNGRPITELHHWKHYYRIYEWIKCLRDRIEGDAVADCGCLPSELRDGQ